MHDLTGEAAERRRRFGLKAQLLLLLLALNLIAAVAYSAVLYDIDRTDILQGIDSRLVTAAYAVREIVPPGYHRRITGPDSIPPAEFDAIADFLLRCGAQRLELAMADRGPASSPEPDRQPVLA